MYNNPILYADYSDPDVIRVGEDYYMVASSFTYIPGVPILHSKDLVHWEIINYCVKRLPFEKYDKPSHGSGTWAPSIRYYNGTFYVFIPLVDEGILVARSSDPYSEFELNMICYSKGWIDPCPFWDDDGKAYMVFAYARSRCGVKHRLALAEIDTDCRCLLGNPKIIFDGEQIAPTTEGPKIYKYNEWYYILMPSGGVATGWQSALRSKNIEGPYEYKVVMHQGCTKINGPHQGGLVDTPDGKHWFIHFQDVIELGRITHLQPVCFINEWPFIGSDLDGDGIGEPVNQWNMPIEGQIEYEILQSDEFTGESLGLQWQWQANPNDRFYSLKEQKGIRLNCVINNSRENLLWYAPNAMTQIPQNPQFTAVTKVHLEGKEDGDMASMGIIGHIYSYIGLKKCDNEQRVVLYVGNVLDREFEGKAIENLVESCQYNDKDVYLRVQLGEEKLYEFSWSEDGIDYHSIGQPIPLKSATWTGAKLCLWACNRNNIPSLGYGVYDYIHIEGSRLS